MKFTCFTIIISLAAINMYTGIEGNHALNYAVSLFCSLISIPAAIILTK